MAGREGRVGAGAGWRRASWGCGCAVTALSLLPAWLFPPSLPTFFGADKLAHFGIYGTWGVLMRLGYGRRWTAPAAGAAWGLLMELSQGWLAGGGRSFEWSDALANLLGIGLGWLAAGRAGQGYSQPRDQ